MIPGTMSLELLFESGPEYYIFLYTVTALITVISARISDMVKDADAEKKGMVGEDGKGYPIESVWIPVAIGVLVVPFVWLAISVGSMSAELSMVTAVSTGYISREYLAIKVGKYIKEVEDK